MQNFKTLLAGGDLRSIGNSNKVVNLVKGQSDFDSLIKLVFDDDKLVAMRAADAVQKISVKNPLLLAAHKPEILAASATPLQKEVKWHIAQLIPLLCLNAAELRMMWEILQQWALDASNSRIVRVNALQALFDLTKINPCNNISFERLLTKMERENVPSINARIKRIRHLQVL
ncbi:MAG TPA: hypothetical protein VHB48_13005 [Chitinophagaceae bacterium]|nr:hypothetical protein [Chitinophagaceae bacterium]